MAQGSWIWGLRRDAGEHLQEASCVCNGLGVQLDYCTNIDHSDVGAPVAVRQCADEPVDSQGKVSSVVGFGLTATTRMQWVDVPQRCFSGV